MAAASGCAATTVAVVRPGAGRRGPGAGAEPSAATDTFVSASSPSYRATVAGTAAVRRRTVSDAGARAADELLTPAELAALTELEACLGGQYDALDATLPPTYRWRRRHAAYGGAGSPCGELMRHRPVRSSTGPARSSTARSRRSTPAESELAAARRADQAAAAKAQRLARARGLSRAAARRRPARRGRRGEEELARLESLAGRAGSEQRAVDTDDGVHRAARVRRLAGPTIPRRASRTCSRPRRRADPGPAAPVAERRPAGAGDPLDPRGGRGCRGSGSPPAGITWSAGCRSSSPTSPARSAARSASC